MRIALVGPPDLVRPITGLLLRAGHLVVAARPALLVTLAPGMPGHDVDVDGVDSLLEARIVTHVAELATTGAVRLKRRGGVQSDRAIAMTVPPADIEAVGRALARACFEVETRQPEMRKPPRRRWLGLFVAAVLLSCGAARQEDLRLADAIAERDMALHRLAQLEAALIEKDRQLAALQYRHGKELLDLRAQLLDADASTAECQLGERLAPVVERLRQFERPSSDAQFDLTVGRFVRPKE